MERLLEDVAAMKVVTQSLIESGDKALATSDKGTKRFVELGLYSKISFRAVTRRLSDGHF